MFNRDGSLSTFGVTQDLFVIKKPFPLSGAIPDDALIKADHINHYFDACIKIQQYLKPRLGRSLATHDNNWSLSSDTLSYGTATLATSTHVLTVSTPATLAITSLNLTVPSVFGSTPFADNTFTIVPTLTIKDSVNKFSQGLSYYDMPDGDLFSNLQALPQFYPVITPVNPSVNNQFTVAIRSTDTDSGVVRGLGQLISGLVTEELEFLNIKNAQSIKRIEPFLWTEPLNSNYCALSTAIVETNGVKYLRLYSNKLGQPVTSLLLSKIKSGTDVYTEGTFKGKFKSTTLARGGLCLAKDGSTQDNFTGWLLVFDDGVTGAALSTSTIRLLEVQNVNLGLFTANASTIPGWNGTVTLLSNITLPVGNKVRLSYNGSAVTVRDTTTLTNIFTTSTLGISGNFTPGYFSKAESNSTATTGLTNSYVEIATPLIVKGTSDLPVFSLKLLYVKSTSTSSVTTDTI